MGETFPVEQSDDSTLTGPEEVAVADIVGVLSSLGYEDFTVVIDVDQGAIIVRMKRLAEKLTH